MATFGKPTTSFYVNYGPLDPMAAQRALAPVIIAPRYRLHTWEGTGLKSAKLLGDISLIDLNDRAKELAWPGRDEKSKDILDLESAVVYVNNAAVVIYDELEFSKPTAAKDNQLYLAKTTEGFGVAVGDVLLFGSSIRAEVVRVVVSGENYVITLDCDLSAVTDLKAKVISTRPMALVDANKVDGVLSVSETGIILGDNLSVDGYTLVDGDIYVEYRELLVDDVFDLRTNLGPDVLDWAGACDVKNPMGLMYAACAGVDEGAFFYMVSIPSESEADYIKAIEYVAQFEDCYAIITYKQTAAVQTALKTTINKYSQPEIARRKRTWLCAAEDSNKVIYARDDENAALKATVSAGILQLASGDLYKAKVFDGDYAVIAIDADKKVRYMIKDVLSKSSVELENKELSIDTDVNVVFERGTNGALYSAELARQARVCDSSRVNFVAADVLEFAGMEVPTVCACAALAAQRCALPPHAPMNDMVLPGFTIVNTMNWTDTDYELMNAGGCWVLYRDIDGRTLTYHQITTKTDGTIAEEDSVVSNGDSIVRTLRQSVAPLCGGKGNATQALLNRIEIVLIANFESISGEYYPELYGPRIITYAIPRLYIPEGNKRSVMCECNIEIPQPTQDSKFVFNLF